MTQDDSETVLSLIKKTAMFTPAEVSVANELIDIYLRDPQQKDYDAVVVENADGRVVGYMVYGPTPLTEGAYDLYWMAVAPEHQGRGYGTELVRWLEKKVTDAGGRLILVETSSQPKYEATRRFYLGLDYREVSRIRDFYRPGDDRVSYAKYFRKKE